MNKLKEAPIVEKPSQAKLAIKKFLDDALKKAGIKVLQHQEMKKGTTQAIYGIFYKVESRLGDDIMPFYVSKKGEINLGVSGKGFIVGKYGDMNKVVKNLKDFKTSDLDESVNEGNLPSNIQKWIRDRGPKPSKDVKMIGKWVKKLTGHEISGGVAIGKNYNTLVMDIEHEDAAINYDTTSGDIRLYKKIIRNFDGFKKVFQSANESVNEGGDSLPGNVKRFMEKFVDALEQTGLNRKRKIAVLAGIIDALDIEPQKLISMVNKIKAGVSTEGTIKEGANKRLGWMDDLIDQLGSEKKVLEEVFRALSDKEAKEVHDWIMRHWS